MDTFFKYLKIAIWLSPILIFCLSFLHLRQKVTAGTFTGYSAKGQFMLGVAFTFCGISFLFEVNWVSLIFSLLYGITLFVAVKVESKAKK